MSPRARGTPVTFVGGPPSLARDVVLGAVRDAGMRVVQPEKGDAVEVAVLVDPLPGDWDIAMRLGGGVVLVSEQPVEGQRLADAVRRGADAVVDLTSGLAWLVEAVRGVADAGAALSPDQARRLVDALRAEIADSGVAPKLSPREAEVLQSVARGESIKQTARALGISIKTVENLQSRLHLKLGVRNRAQAVARAHALGLLESED